MAGAGSFALGVQYPLVIGLLAGIFELVPMLGPILGAVPAIGIAAFQSWQLAVAVVVLFIVIQQIESQLIAPRIMGHAVGVHPVVAILAVLMGAELDGIFGALVAVPISGLVYVAVQAVYSQLAGEPQLVTVVRKRPFYVRVFRRVRRSTVQTEVKQEGENVEVTVEAPSDQLAEIAHSRDVLAEQFEIAQKVAEEAEKHLEPTSSTASQDPSEGEAKAK